MEDTSGFYYHDQENNELIYGPNYVYLPCKTVLKRETKDDHEYPVKGWRWFDTAEEAYAFFKVEMPTE